MALGKLGELQKRSGELKKKEEILSFIEKLEIPSNLKAELLNGPMNIGFVLPPAPAGCIIDTTNLSINRMIEKVRAYEKE